MAHQSGRGILDARHRKNEISDEFFSENLAKFMNLRPWFLNLLLLFEWRDSTFWEENCYWWFRWGAVVHHPRHPRVCRGSNNQKESALSRGSSPRSKPAEIGSGTDIFGPPPILRKQASFSVSMEGTGCPSNSFTHPSGSRFHHQCNPRNSKLSRHEIQYRSKTSLFHSHVMLYRISENMMKIIENLFGSS
jgi:hypothetical protein